MRIGKSEDPFTLGTIDCGYCGIKFGRERCISTSIVSARSKADIELLCVSMLASGLLAGAIEKPSEMIVGTARDLFDEIKKGTRK